MNITNSTAISDHVKTSVHTIAIEIIDLTLDSDYATDDSANVIDLTDEVTDAVAVHVNTRTIVYNAVHHTDDDLIQYINNSWDISTHSSEHASEEDDTSTQEEEGISTHSSECEDENDNKKQRII